MNHCVNEVHKYLKAVDRRISDDADINATHREFGENILAFAEAWDAGDLTRTAEHLTQLIWHGIALSELLGLPTHPLFLDVRNLHVAGLPLNIQDTLEKHL